MERAIEPLESARAIGRLEADGPWIGFGYRAGLPRFVVGLADGLRDGAGDRDLLLTLAIAYFAEAVSDAPPDLEATQADLSALVRHLLGAERDRARRALLSEAIDAIDDGLAGDAVAQKLDTARSAQGDAVDPVELLSRKVRQMAAAG
jgi:hypothetical protein